MLIRYSLICFDEITDLIHENQIPLAASMIYLMRNIASELIVESPIIISDPL